MVPVSNFDGEVEAPDVHRRGRPRGNAAEAAALSGAWAGTGVFAPDGAGTRAFSRNVAGPMSRCGVRCVLGPRRKEALCGAFDRP